MQESLNATHNKVPSRSHETTKWSWTLKEFTISCRDEHSTSANTKWNVLGVLLASQSTIISGTNILKAFTIHQFLCMTLAYLLVHLKKGDLNSGRKLMRFDGYLQTNCCRLNKSKNLYWPLSQVWQRLLALKYIFWSCNCTGCMGSNHHHVHTL